VNTQRAHAVGIDLGTTYSCLAYLNEHGEPVTLANQEGELATPSVVFFDEDHQVVVGTEALRNAIVRPDRVVQNSKRHIGDPAHHWKVDDQSYTPVDIASYVLRKLLAAAHEQIGAVERAVVTVPAQFSELQRRATIEAGHRAGLKQVDIINEPVAAALCYVLGTEGLWFTELADEQRILVYDLGGGTFDLSLVKYHKDEVCVVASSGDLKLGGIDWNASLEKAISERFVGDFDADPRQDPRSRQALALEIETTKRSLSVRPRAALTVQHASHRKTYQVQQQKFAELTRPLVERTAVITQKMLADNKMGWAHVDVILTTGGASRMPMIRDRLKELGGRTLNTSLSPDQSIAHGATYYAGMLLTNTEFSKAIDNKEVSNRLARMKQVSVNARGLGILVQNQKKVRVPHYLIPPNTPLPAKLTQTFGTVVDNQKRVHLQIVESPATEGRPHAPLGACVIDDLSPNLPEGSEIAVTIAYDEQAKVHVTAVDVVGGKEASTEIIRPENVMSTEVDAEAGEGPEAGAGSGDASEPIITLDDFQVEEWADSTSAAAVRLPEDDTDILDLNTPQAAGRKRQPARNKANATQRKRTGQKKRAARNSGSSKSRPQSGQKNTSSGTRQTVKPPPLPPGLDASQDSAGGEEEFWNLPEP